MNITLMHTSQPNNAMNKNPSTVSTITGALRSDTSVQNPVITVNSSVNVLVGANYLFIPSFNRYYYIIDIVAKTNVTSEIHCKVDVLHSFRGEILANAAIVTRQASSSVGNVLLDDSIYTVASPQFVDTYSYGGSFGTGFVLTVATPF